MKTATFLTPVGRAATAGLSDEIHVHFFDYRDIPLEWENASSGYVRSEHYANYFRLVSFALEPQIDTISDSPWHYSIGALSSVAQVRTLIVFYDVQVVF